MEMEVLGEGLAPRVQDRGDPDRAAEVPRIAAEGEQRVGGRAEEQRIDHARIALRQRIEQMRERQDDVAVRNGQEVGGDPLVGSDSEDDGPQRHDDDGVGVLERQLDHV